MDKAPCNCKTEKKVKSIIKNTNRVTNNNKSKTPKNLPKVIITAVKFATLLVLFVFSLILFIPFIFYLIFSKKAKNGIVINIPIQKLLKNV